MRGEQLKKQKTVERWFDQVSQGVGSRSTERLYLHFMDYFITYTGMQPDELIKERREHMKSDDPEIQNQHEELLKQYRTWLEDEKGIARNSVGTADGVIKSFYSSNYAALKTKPPKTWRQTRRSTPTREDLKGMVEVCDLNRDKAVVMVLAQTGLSIGILKNFTWESISTEYDKKLEPLHFHTIREKTMTEFDTFLGSNGLTCLRPYIEEKVDKNKLDPEKPIFDISERTIQNIVRHSSLASGMDPHSSPHNLRKFFSTYLALAKVPQQQIDYWMGHAIAYGGAYYVPPIKEQRELYSLNEKAISIW